MALAVFTRQTLRASNNALYEPFLQYFNPPLVIIFKKQPIKRCYRFLAFIIMRQIITHFTDDDLYKFTMCCAVIDNFPRAQVKYSFKDRDDTQYPEGFDQLVMEQVRYLENVVITDEEIVFMRRKCNYIPEWFYPYLKGFRYSASWVRVSLDANHHLHIDFEGAWSETILLEVKVLAIVSELYYMVTGQDKVDYDAYYRKSYHKAERLLEAGCIYTDFGTRRRLSLEAEDVMVRAMKDCYQSKPWKGRFVGTSNVWLAMKHDLTPVGTMAHEFVCAIGGMYGPQMANHLAMEAWRNTFRGALGTYLYDSFGWDIFSLNFSEDFANLFKGLRVDSGDNRKELQRIVEKYRSLGVQDLKFFKMDDMARLGYVASSILLQGLEYGPEDIAVLLSNSSASLDSDLRHQANLDSGKGASPAVFVYTLPNVTSGEISIRHKIKGENTFFISEGYDREKMMEYASLVLAESKAGYAIVGWIDYLRGNFSADLELVRETSCHP